MSVGEVSWLFEHSERTSASPAFVWRFWTDVGNWKDPPATFRIEGPFARGTRGVTLLPDREPVRWRLEDVEAGRSYTIASDLDGAVVLWHWRFEPSPEGTRLTQRIGLFGPTIEPGMKRIAALLADAEARDGS